MRVLVPLGTRPEIIKLAPVITALRGKGIEVQVVATGQHYDPSLADSFFHDLSLTPDVRWTLEGSDSERVATILRRGLDLVAANRPDVVLLLGDTNTVPLFCLAARRAGVPVAHIEAGLRSFNPVSMEEVNRRVAGALASLHFAPTDLAAKFLRDEGVEPERVRVVGNPIIDVLRRSGRTPMSLEQRSGALVTAHRASNVDDPLRLGELVALVAGLAERNTSVIFPVHPRTRQRLRDAGFEGSFARVGVKLLDPVPWEAMLDLVRTSRIVLTDSGGLQEEASYFGVPVVVLRRTTPRWEGVEAGTSVLTGLDAKAALAAVDALSDEVELCRIAAVPCPYGDGHTSERIADILIDPATAGLLELKEPDVNQVLPFSARSSP